MVAVDLTSDMQGRLFYIGRTIHDSDPDATMLLIRHPARRPLDRPTAVAIGNFDGLHRGHMAVIARMKALAAAQGLVPTVLTFEPHPRAFFAPHMPFFRLEPLQVKLRRLRAADIACVVVPRFDETFAALGPAQFLDEVLGRQLQAKAVITGENFAFGRQRAGNSGVLRSWGEECAIAVALEPPVVMADGTVCSSTAVRMAVGEGNMARAAQLLGRPYHVSGRVVHGDGRGAGLGFATANLALPPRLKLPAHGVYAVRVRCPQSTAYGSRIFDGVANFGTRPTVAQGALPRLEVHLFDFSGELYGARLEVDVIARLREEKRFDSLAALTHQIAEDCLAAKTALSGDV
jgi:riboflavin kinase/FMN adenylyltransferase